MEHEYVDDRNYITYGDQYNPMVFIRRCPQCSRFVKSDESVYSNENTGAITSPNATCSKHGRVSMPFIGYM
jgi:hypothetical protein